MDALNKRLKIGDYKAIQEQMGGRRFETMTGSKTLYYAYDENGYVSLNYKLAKNKAKAQFLKVQYTLMDDYTMTFTRVKKTQNPEYKKLGIKIYDEEIITIQEIENVCGDELQQVFKNITGLDTRL